MKTGELYVVSTPIGNLEDITMRAVKILGSVHVIACEDTRKSRVLLKRWNISTPTLSLHRFSEARKTKAILDRLESGEDVALISDAGTPAVSDPGSRLVSSAMEAGFRVVPIPGPSAITAALSASGFDGASFVYHGYAPRTDGKRKSFFEHIRDDTRPSIFFETPVRITRTLAVGSEILGSRRMVLCRELTKIHEEILPGTASAILASLEARTSVKGEIVVVVDGGAGPASAVDLNEAVETLMKEGLSGKRLADEARRRFGLGKSAAYQRFLELKQDRDAAEEDEVDANDSRP